MAPSYSTRNTSWNFFPLLPRRIPSVAFSGSAQHTQKIRERRQNMMWVCHQKKQIFLFARFYGNSTYWQRWQQGCKTMVLWGETWLLAKQQWRKHMVPRGLEPRTLRLLAVRSNQLSYETCDGDQREPFSCQHRRFLRTGFWNFTSSFCSLCRQLLCQVSKSKPQKKMKKKEPRTQMLLLQNKTAWHRRWHPDTSPYLFPWTYQGKLRDGYFYIFGSLVRDCLLSRFLLAIFICTGFHILEFLKKLMSRFIAMKKANAQRSSFLFCFHNSILFDAASWRLWVWVTSVDTSEVPWVSSWPMESGRCSMLRISHSLPSIFFFHFYVSM